MLAVGHFSMIHRVSAKPVPSLDIVHGDVKCENVLIFERDEDEVAAQGLRK